MDWLGGIVALLDWLARIVGILELLVLWISLVELFALYYNFWSNETFGLIHWSIVLNFNSS
jgi:hypothetical protein